LLQQIRCKAVFSSDSKASCISFLFFPQQVQLLLHKFKQFFLSVQKTIIHSCKVTEEKQVF